MTSAQLVQQLLRDADSELQRAREGMGNGTDLLEVAQDLRSAGESFIAAADEMAVAAREGRRAAGGRS